MSSSIIWKCIPGDEMVDAFSESSLSELVPQSSALYLWRRRIVYDPSITSTPQACIDWLEDLAEQPAAVLGTRPLSHCVTIEGLVLGGGGLTHEKRDAIPSATQQRRMRERVARIMSSLTNFMPPLYIGEANNLRMRVHQHLRGDTGLQYYIESSLGLRWADLEMHYHELSRSPNTSAEAKRIQELLEFLAQRAIAPFGTARPG